MKFLFYYSLYIGIIFLAFQVYFCFRKKTPEQAEIPKSYPHKESWLALLVIFMIKASLIILLLSTGFITIWHDDVIRWLMALGWQSHPWFAPRDHVWLGMSFYIYGLSMKIIPDPLVDVFLNPVQIFDK